MPFYMNPFNQEYKGLYPQVDHHAFAKSLITYTVPNNKNNSTAMIAWNTEPYDFSSLPNLTINYAVNSVNDFKGFSALVVCCWGKGTWRWYRFVPRRKSFGPNG